MRFLEGDTVSYCMFGAVLFSSVNVFTIEPGRSLCFLVSQGVIQAMWPIKPLRIDLGNLLPFSASSQVSKNHGIRGKRSQ